MQPLVLIRRVVGASMEPTLRPGSIIIAVRRSRLQPGHIVIFSHNGLEKVKRIERINGKRVFVVGDNGEVSTDSRAFGWIMTEMVTHQVVWPRPKARKLL